MTADISVIATTFGSSAQETAGERTAEVCDPTAFLMLIAAWVGERQTALPTMQEPGAPRQQALEAISDDPVAHRVARAPARPITAATPRTTAERSPVLPVDVAATQRALAAPRQTAVGQQASGPTAPGMIVTTDGAHLHPVADTKAERSPVSLLLPAEVEPPRRSTPQNSTPSEPLRDLPPPRTTPIVDQAQIVRPAARDAGDPVAARKERAKTRSQERPAHIQPVPRVEVAVTERLPEAAPRSPNLRSEVASSPEPSTERPAAIPRGGVRLPPRAAAGTPQPTDRPTGQPAPALPRLAPVASPEPPNVLQAAEALARDEAAPERVAEAGQSDAMTAPLSPAPPTDGHRATQGTPVRTSRPAAPPQAPATRRAVTAAPGAPAEAAPRVTETDGEVSEHREMPPVSSPADTSALPHTRTADVRSTERSQEPSEGGAPSAAHVELGGMRDARIAPSRPPGSAPPFITIRESARISPSELSLDRPQRLVVEVDPPHLGRCELELSLHEGHVRATLIADRPETVVALRAVEGQVREHLAARDLQVTEFDVRQGAQQAADHDTRQGPPGDGRDRRQLAEPTMSRMPRPLQTAPRAEPRVLTGGRTVDLVA